MRKTLRRPTVLLAGLAVLSGCALPLPIVLAGYAADGISLVASERTLSDHALSAGAEEDCALWRVVTDEEICIDDGRRIDIMVASADGPVVYGAPTQAAPRPAADSAPSVDAATGPVAILPAGAPIGAIAALVSSDSYADIRNAGERNADETPVLSAAVTATPAEVSRTTAPAREAAHPDLISVSELGFAVPFPPVRPEARSVADSGGSPLRSVSHLPSGVSDIPRPPTMPARRGVVATLPAGAAGIALPPPVPAERG